MLYKPLKRGETADNLQMFSILESKYNSLRFPKLLKSSKYFVVYTILEVVNLQICVSFFFFPSFYQQTLTFSFLLSLPYCHYLP